MVAINFNAAQVEPNKALEAIPTGQYPVMITASTQKPTKNGLGQYIEFEMTVQGGEYAGRKVFDRLNIVNDNQTAVDIAYSTLSSICHVTGRLQIQQTEQLHGVPFIAVVQKKERDDQPGNFTNEIRGYKDINGNDPSHGAAGSPNAGQAPAQPSWGNAQQAQQQQVQQPVQEQSAQQAPWNNAAPVAPAQQQQAAPATPAGNTPPWVVAQN